MTCYLKVQTNNTQYLAVTTDDWLDVAQPISCSFVQSANVMKI
jgi:hypothetical protein